MVSGLARRRPFSDIDEFGAAHPQKFGWLDPQQGPGRSPAGEDQRQSRDLPIHKGAERRPMAEWGEGTDRVAGDGQHGPGAGQADSFSSHIQIATDGSSIHVFRAPGDHQERFADDEKEQGLDDLSRRRTHGGGSEIYGRRLDGQRDDLSPDAMRPDERLKV